MSESTSLPVHYMKFMSKEAYCGTPRDRVDVAYDDWAKVTCSGCLFHPANPRWEGATS